MELLAGLLEALGREERGGKEEVRGLLLAVGCLVYAAPKKGEVVDLCKALGARGVVEGVGGGKELEELVREVSLVVR